MVLSAITSEPPEADEPAAPKFSAKLVVRGSTDSEELAAGSFEISGGSVIIGRTAEDGIQIQHPSVSATHAQIREVNGRFEIFDLGSRNGTWVNDEVVSGVPLKDGTRINIGGSGLFFTQLGRVAMRPGALGVGSRGVIMVQSGPSLGQNFPVGDQDMIVGREPGDGGVKVDDPQVELHHALLRPTEDGCMIFDLGSPSGTKINDVPLAGSPLHNGDVIKLGLAELEFVQENSS